MERDELVRALQEINTKNSVSLYKREVCLKAADLIEAQAREIKALQKQLILRNDELLKLRVQVPQWVSVTERLPEPDEKVIAYIPSGVYVKSVTVTGSYIRCCNDTSVVVTHWMPLPDGPKEDA